MDQPGAVARDDGDVPSALATAESIVEVEYTTPFLAHATMEPLTCTAHIRTDGAELWVGHQNQSALLLLATAITGLPPESITLNQTYLGCGLGRRGETDFVADALLAAREVDVPVKVVWTREDDIRHDFYRPATVQRLRASLDRFGTPSAWWYQTVGDSFLFREDQAPPATGGTPPPEGPQPTGSATPVASPPIEAGSAASAPAAPGGFAAVDFFLVSGMDADFPYRVPNLRVEATVGQSGIPVGPWRGIGHTQNVFAIESFVDELAAVAGVDPLEYRRALLSDGDPRAAGVLDRATENAGWGEVSTPGRGSGIAVSRYGETWVAHVADVEMLSDEDFTVRRIVCAVDCGTIISLDSVNAQAVGGIVYGLTATLQGQITITGGRVEQGNFDDYPVLRYDEVPVIDVLVVPSERAPGGIGEATVPGVAPAVANAVFAASGKRIRTLPLRPLS